MALAYFSVLAYLVRGKGTPTEEEDEKEEVTSVCPSPMSGRRVSFQEPVAEDKEEIAKQLQELRQQTDVTRGATQPPSPESPPFQESRLGEDADIQESLTKDILPVGGGGGVGLFAAGICGLIVFAVVFVMVFHFLTTSSNKQRLRADPTTTEQVYSDRASTSVEFFNFSDIGPRVNDTVHRRRKETVDEEYTEVHTTT